MLDAFAGAQLGLDVLDVTDMWPAPDEPFAVTARRLLQPPRDTGAGVVLTHFPLVSLRERCADVGLLYSGHLRNLAKEPELVATRDWRATVVLNGHLHVRAARRRESIYQLSCAALVEPPYDVTAVDVHVHDGALRVHYECAPIAAAAHVESRPVLAPARGRHAIALDA